MALLEQVKQILSDYANDISETKSGEFELEFYGNKFLIENADFDLFIEKKDSLTSDNETRIFDEKYFEQTINAEGRFSAHQIFRNEDRNSMVSKGGSQIIEIGDASPLFILHILSTSSMSLQLQRRYNRRMLAIKRNETLPLSEMLRIKTLKITVQESKSSSTLIKLAQAATFHFGYVNGIAINLTTSWEKARHSLRRRPNEGPSFPQQFYDSELIKYYNLGLGTDSVVLTYLAFYNILEYFYPLVSEEELHNKIKENLFQPDFSVKKRSKLRKLVKDIGILERKLNELESLKLVLKKYFKVEEITDWISNFESEFGQYYTAPANLFGTSKQLNTNHNLVIDSLATRIYLVRNALVHNKEGVIGRFIPFTEHDEILIKEIPLLRFLSEQLIIRTGTDIV